MRLFPVATACAALVACAPMEKPPETTAAPDDAETIARTMGGSGEPYAEDRRTEKRQCFFQRQVSGYREAPDGPDGERIYVDVGANDTYLFETFGSCPELDWARGIAFDTTGVGQICDGLDVDLIVPDRNLGPQRCPVRMIRKLDDGEEGARG